MTGPQRPGVLEQQVAEILESDLGRLLEPVVVAATKVGVARDLQSINRSRAELETACDQLADWLTARVAQAIEAAAWDKTDPPWAVSPVRVNAALAALRGDPPA